MRPAWTRLPPLDTACYGCATGLRCHATREPEAPAAPVDVRPVWTRMTPTSPGGRRAWDRLWALLLDEHSR